MANVVAQEGLEHRIAVIAVEPGFVLTETMAATFAAGGVAETTAIPPAVPASAIAYLCTCDDPMRYTGEIVERARARRRARPLSALRPVRSTVYE